MNYYFKKFNVLCWFLFGFSMSIEASTITPEEGQAIYKSSSVNGDVLVVHSPNESGISFNNFSEFKVQDIPLKLVNSPVNKGDSYNDAAKLVVIIADEILINNQVELLGPASDILFLSSDDDGYISCNSCSFENFYRITLAAAETESIFPTTDGLIGKLTTSPSGEVVINNLSAKGALAVEALAKTVTLDGLIDTHDRADAEGIANINGYSQSQNGSFTIGTGSVNLMLGHMEWDYDNKTILKVNPSSVSAVLNGSIQSTEVKISSSSPLALNTKVNTKVDVLSTTQYFGKTYLPVESIRVMDFSEGITYLNNELMSDGQVVVNSGGSINIINEKSNISASSVNLISVGKTYNDKRIRAEQVDIASDSFVNRGLLTSDGDVTIWSKNNISNEFGGEILARKVKLHSELGVVRNGSRVPYLTSILEKEEMLAFSSDFIDNSHLPEVGTFYRDGVNIDLSSKPELERAKAFITGGDIEIIASSFENINPYWVVLNNESVRVSGALKERGIKDLDSYFGFILEVHFDEELKNDLSAESYEYSDIDSQFKFFSQVLISAENSLKVIVDDYAVNSSALIRVNSSSGELSIVGKLLSNERYLNVNGLDYSHIATSKLTSVWPVEQVYDEEHVNSRTYVYSPAGAILSMGDFKIKSDIGFLNENSYFEVFGSADFNTPKVNNFGTKITGYDSENIVDPGVNKDCWGAEDFCMNRPATLKGRKVSLTEIDEYDSLFYVHGDALGNGKTDFNTETQSIMDYFVDQLLDRGTITERDVEVQSKALFDNLIKLAKELFDELTEFLNSIDWWSEE